MGTTLNKEAYIKVINENIEALEKYMPEHSLEKKHTIDVLKWSINELYENDNSFKIQELQDRIAEIDKSPSSLKEAATPLIKYMAENNHPHTTCIVTSTSVELLEGKEIFNTNEFLVD